VVFAAAFAFGETGRSLYRPCISDRGLEGFDVADTVGSHTGTVALIFATLNGGAASALAYLALQAASPEAIREEQHEPGGPSDDPDTSDMEERMILLTFRSQGSDGLSLGIKTEKGVINVRAALEALGPDLEGVPDTPKALYAQGLSALPALTALIAAAMPRSDGATWMLSEASLTLGPCVPSPEKILCVGLNYRQHIAETNAETPKVPVLFSKFDNALAAPGEPVPIPRHVVEIDYEAELAVVIGREAKYIAEEKALDHVLGYCNANDISARELQMRTSQWLLGKTLDKFLPLGPYLVTADEVEDPQQLAVRSWLNGELRQDSNTADMLFSTAHIISYASQYMTLRTGDVICTGTPEGVILGKAEKVWMRPGDEITIQVGSLGPLTNCLVSDG
jgi:2-keto-4-pentenoate hydratase/2-oxohepta-3-ene-1,7-dioic acid hydratase in catechol pathway